MLRTVIKTSDRVNAIFCNSCASRANTCDTASDTNAASMTDVDVRRINSYDYSKNTYANRHYGKHGAIVPGKRSLESCWVAINDCANRQR